MNLILFFLILSFFNPKPKSPTDFVWENRILILQSYQGDSVWFDDNLKSELENRKLLIFQFEGNKLKRSSFEGEIDASKFLEKLTQRNGSNVAWTLVGLDGGVKKSGFENPKPLEIFKLIDSMPMRQSELKNSKK